MPELIRVDVQTRGFNRLQRALETAGRNVKPALRRAINWTGDRARTRVTRALVKQLWEPSAKGAKNRAVRKQLDTRRASDAFLVYRIIARGAAMSLKEFGPRKTARGISAAPWGKRRIFPHSFVVSKLGGHVFVRTTSKRFPLKKLWGPIIPHELVKDQSAKAFETTVDTELPPRLVHEIEVILEGHVPS